MIRLTTELENNLRALLAGGDPAAIDVFSGVMMLDLIGAAISGTLVRLGPRLLKIEPALASGVIVTTETDVTGNRCLLGLATLLRYVMPVAQ